MKIGSCDIAEKVFIIAEIGANHEGSFELAKELVEAASTTGADAVKFQTYRADKIVIESETQLRQKFSRFELRDDEFLALAELCAQKGLMFLSTPFDIESVDLLDPVVPAFKISSGDVTCSPLIDHIASKGKPILFSTGMATEEEIASAMHVIKKRIHPMSLDGRVVLLHCVTNYPTLPEDAHLKMMDHLRDQFNVPVGYSDHTLGIIAPLAAVARGARVIEKHFTLDHNQSDFRDHQLSADIEEMRELVQGIRAIEKMLGEYKKEPVNCETNNRITMRRSIVARQNIPKGEAITADMLTFLRPAKGLSPTKWDEVVGSMSARDIAEGAYLVPEDIK